MRIWPILAETDTDVTWKIGGLEICKYADEQVKCGLTTPLYSAEALFVPRKCFRRLEFQDFEDAADWNAMSDVAVTTDNRVRFEQ